MTNPDLLLRVRALALEAEAARWLNYTLAPAITMLVFAWLLTLDLEVSLIWGSPWSGMKVLFLFTRYSPLIDVPALMYFQLGKALPQHTCKITYECVIWAFKICHGLAVLMLTLRTWAVHGRGKKLGYALFGMYGSTGAACLVLVGLYLRSSIFRTSEFPGLIGCTLQANDPYLAIIYVLLMFYDGSLLLLMASKGISALKEAGNSQLTRVVYRDGILYYIYIFALSLVNVVVILRLQGAYMTLAVPIERAAYAVLACRVILHIREQGHRESQLSQQNIGSLRFARVPQSTDGALGEFSGERDIQV